MTNILPCTECESDINKHFTVRLIDDYYINTSWKIGVASCDNCGEMIPFRSQALSPNEFHIDAIKAWNTKTSPSRNDILEQAIEAVSPYCSKPGVEAIENLKDKSLERVDCKGAGDNDGFFELSND